MSIKQALEHVGKLSPVGSFAVVLVMAAGSYFTNSAQTKELDRRVDVIEQNYVPRAEHVVRNSELDRRLLAIESGIAKVDSKVDKLLERHK